MLTFRRVKYFIYSSTIVEDIRKYFNCFPPFNKSAIINTEMYDKCRRSIYEKELFIAWFLLFWKSFFTILSVERNVRVLKIEKNTRKRVRKWKRERRYKQTDKQKIKKKIEGNGKRGSKRCSKLWWHGKNNDEPFNTFSLISHSEKRFCWIK